MLRRRSLAVIVCGLLLAAAPVDVTWAADGYRDGLQALALLQTLNAELLSHDSATATLQAWCDAHGGNGAKIRADRVKGQDKPPSQAAGAALGLEPGQAVRYRRVRLSCGDKVLSEADNWYLPERLTPEMNRTLDTSDTPFGVVARPLDFRRRTLSARLLYHPLPEGWESRPAGDADPPPIPAEVLQHSAILTTSSAAPLAFVVETYTGAALRMALPIRSETPSKAARWSREGIGALRSKEAPCWRNARCSSSKTANMTWN